MTAAARPIALWLREPPSANRWWRNVGGRMVTSAAAREYKQHVANAFLVGRHGKIAGPEAVAVAVYWHRGRKSGDLDKRLGVLLDALQGCAYDSDSQVAAIRAYRLESPRNPGVHVSVRKWGDWEDAYDPDDGG